jgi:hypothetical protein
VLCSPARGREQEHFSVMVLENSARKVDNPITRGELFNRAMKYYSEEEAADLIGVKPAMARQLAKLLDLHESLQTAVAAGELAIKKALTAHGKSVAEQKAMLEAWRNPAPKDKSAPKPPSKKKVYAVLGAAESWQQSGGSRDDLSVFLLRWFAGYETDDALAKRAPHLATDLKIAGKKKAKVAT